jgi:hypothetical protein
MRDYLVGFFTRAVFDTPWRADDISSLVYETPTGEVTAFLGVMPRDMSFDGSPIRAAVATAFMVDPASRPAGVALLRHLLRGPQDLTLTDGATDRTRRILEALRFRSFPTMSASWFRLFAPAQLALDRYTRVATPVRRLLARAGRPVCRMLDRVAAHVGDLDADIEETYPTSSRPVGVAELLSLVDEEASRRRLRPRYDAGSLQWVLADRRRAAHRGVFVQNVVERADGQRLGWYLAHMKRGGASEIVQMGAADGALEIVLGRALLDSARHGSAMVQGRLDGHLLRPALVNGCFARPTAWMMAHARDPAILEAFAHDDVFCSPLELEQAW